MAEADIFCRAVTIKRLTATPHAGSASNSKLCRTGKPTNNIAWPSQLQISTCSKYVDEKHFHLPDSVADTGGFVRVRTNPPFFQVINLLFHCSMHSASGLVGKPHPLTSNLQLEHSCRGGSCLLTSLQLEFTWKASSMATKSQNWTEAQQTRNNAHRTQPHPPMHAAAVLVVCSRVCWCNMAGIIILELSLKTLKLQSSLELRYRLS